MSTLPWTGGGALSQVPWSSVRQWHTGLPGRDCIETYRATAHPDLVCLGPTRIGGGLIVPMVAWNETVLRFRRDHYLGPALERNAVTQRVEREDLASRSPLARAVFVSLNVRTCLRALDGLRDLGVLTLVLPGQAELDPIARAECAWHDLTVVAVSGSRVRRLVGPDPDEATAPKRRTTADDASPDARDSCGDGSAHPRSTTDLRLEQLLDLAISRGLVSPLSA